MTTAVLNRPEAVEQGGSLKVVIAGGYGAGKTTLVTAVSEIDAVTTNVPLSPDGRSQDTPLPGKTATTVAMDFGRLRLNGGTTVYVFGTPGQQRFWFIWDDLVRGAAGAIVLIDTRRLADSFSTVDYFEHAGMPFIAVINRFDGHQQPPFDEVREALSLAPGVPLVACDARDRAAGRDTLICLVRYLLQRAGRRLPGDTRSSVTAPLISAAPKP